MSRQHAPLTRTNCQVTISDAHETLIHDAVLDYYGKRLATCLLDKTVKVFDVDGEKHTLVETLRGHEGPVWQVLWAHPKFGSILALCLYDGKVIIWQEQDGRWNNIAQVAVHKASVNLVTWAPHEYGPVLLCASSDGCVLVVDFKADGTTVPVVFKAHDIGVNAALWAPVAALEASSAPVRRFVSGGCDNLAKIWRLENGTYVEEARLAGHSDWVRDVAWLPLLLLRLYIASALQDRTVLVWTQEEGGEWTLQPLQQNKFPDVMWRVLWLLLGNVLAASGGDNKVTLWKENLSGGWEGAGEVNQ